MKNLSELTPTQISQVSHIREQLRLLGCDTFNDSAGHEIEWLEANFDSWSARHVFPFFVPKQTIGLATGKNRENFAIYFNDFNAIIEFNEDVYSRAIMTSGHIVIGTNGAGDYISINTNSESGWEVCLISAGDFASFGLSDECILSVGVTFERFLNLILEHPLGYRISDINIW